MLKSLLIGGPLNGQWIEQGREQEKLHLEHDGQTYEYSRTLYLWQAQNAMWLFYWHGKPSSAEVLTASRRVAGRASSPGFGSNEADWSALAIAEAASMTVAYVCPRHVNSDPGAATEN